MAILERTHIQPGVEEIFRHRGRTVSRKKNVTDLPDSLSLPDPIASGDRLYEGMKSREFRLYLISALGQPGSQSGGPSQSESARKSAKMARELGLFAPACGKLVNVGELLEWFVANCFQREFHCPSYWGVTVEGLPNDYDVIIYRGVAVGYVECKSGKLEGIDGVKVRAFLKREIALNPSFSIFLADNVSRKKLENIAAVFRKQEKLYRYEVPGMMNTGLNLETETYRNFIRVIPINCFIVSGDRALTTVFEEVFRFLTVVSDRAMPFENIEAKKDFQS